MNKKQFNHRAMLEFLHTLESEELQNFIDDKINQILARECYSKDLDAEDIVNEAFRAAEEVYNKEQIEYIDKHPFVVGVKSMIEEHQLFNENQGETIREIFNQAAADFCKDDEEIDIIISKRLKNNH